MGYRFPPLNLEAFGISIMMIIFFCQFPQIIWMAA